MKRNRDMKKDDDYYREFNMDIKNYVNIDPRETSIKISLIYMIIGLLWIVSSDSILKLISPNIEVYNFLQTIKGFIYIGVTTILLYTLIINSINKVKKLTKVLFSNYEELNKTYEELLVAEEDLREHFNQEKEMKEKIYQLAYYDDLTGLTNKHYFQKELEFKLKNDLDYKKKFAIIYLGVDNFKKINNTVGYCYGDKLLQAISKKLLEFKDKIDIISRFSGDEFILLISDFNDNNYPIQVARSIINSTNSLWNDGVIDYYINISLGIAIYPEHGKDYDALLTNANTAMHVVKENGGNHFEVYNERINLKKLEYLNIENDLRKAITNNELILYYQPKVCFKSKKIFGVEALIRWKHPQKGMISPLKFIAIAEKNGLVKDIGNWVIREVCEQVEKWINKGYKKIKVSINLSPMEFRQKNLVENINEIFSDRNIDTTYIEFEITENAVFENIDESIEIINSIKELGVKISLDDFGTGYSSLSYLRDLPIDILKLDKSFMRDLKSQKNKSIIKSMIDLFMT
jgi:diguanylate cyclase (GGDEF)-like protein